VLPTQAACRHRPLVQQEGRVGELFRHEAADRKQCAFQTFDEQSQADEHVDKAHDDPPCVGNRSSDDQKLEPEYHKGNGQHVPQRREQCACKLGEHVH
jgi:hypothetical protein